VTAPRLAWGLCGLAVALLAVSWALTLMAADVTPGFDLALSLALLTFPVVGALVASRRPGNPIGWLFCGAGVLFAASSVGHGWAAYALVDREPDLAGGVTAAWLQSWLFLPAIFGTPQLLFLLFPSGRPLGRRWRPAVWLVAAAIVLQAVTSALVPGPLVDSPVEGLQNPMGIAGAGGTIDAVGGVAWGLTMVGLGLGCCSLALRLRRARGDERLQLKWFVYAGGVFALSCLAAAVMFTAEDELPPAGQLLIVAAFSLIPVAAGIAILRHRLYDIDLVIRRTLVYGALTAALAGAYLGTVLLLQVALGPVTRDSGLAIAASTLAAAALFRPLRARIQAAVDRRFYRRRYDAVRTLEAFSGRLRDQLDLDALGADLRGVVQDTVQPAHVSLWLRGPR
jgi:hypothetical protein